MRRDPQARRALLTPARPRTAGPRCSRTGTTPEEPIMPTEEAAAPVTAFMLVKTNPERLAMTVRELHSGTRPRRGRAFP
ncbi:hypothetical protein GCM10009727_46350 [Actinomadura napierensis]|uniref:Uncharacterized protein n=1 Tax=Actinomadura napierensis TaxID=267854 RepID=A0ABN2ZQ39_9ACTN